MTANISGTIVPDALMFDPVRPLDEHGAPYGGRRADTAKPASRAPSRPGRTSFPLSQARHAGKVLGVRVPPGQAQEAAETASGRLPGRGEAAR